MLFERSLFHDASELLRYPHVNDQLPFRYSVMMDMLRAEGIAPDTIDAVVGRGGSACTQLSGITVIDQKLFDDTAAAVGGSEHAAKLGVMMINDQTYGSLTPDKVKTILRKLRKEAENA